MEIPGQMTIDQIVPDQMTIDQIVPDQMAIDQIVPDQMSPDLKDSVTYPLIELFVVSQQPEINLMMRCTPKMPSD